MTVADLIQRLLELDPHLEVRVASDAEGNKIRPLADVMPEYIESGGDVVHWSDLDDFPEATNYAVIWPV